MFKNLSRILAALLLLTTLTAGAVQAAPRSSAEAEMSPLNALWEWVTSWFETLTGDEGCSMDPDGRCRNGATSPEGVDPNS